MDLDGAACVFSEAARLMKVWLMVLTVIPYSSTSALRQSKKAWTACLEAASEKVTHLMTTNDTKNNHNHCLLSILRCLNFEKNKPKHKVVGSLTTHMLCGKAQPVSLGCCWPGAGDQFSWRSWRAAHLRGNKRNVMPILHLIQRPEKSYLCLST